MDQFKIYVCMMPSAFIISLAVSFLILRVLPRLSAHGIMGRGDIPRAKVKEGRMKGKPVRPEIGGLAIVAGLLLGIFVAIGFISYSGIALGRLPLLGAAVTLTLISLISLFDDLYLFLRQQLKPLTLLIAGLFLAFLKAGGVSEGLAVQAGTIVALPLILIPIGIAGASYLVNRFEAAGDLGMGAVAVVSLGVVAFLKGEISALLVLVSGLGVLLAALYYGFGRPALAHGIIGRSSIPRAKELIGDVGTYSIGGLIAVAAVLGGFELAGVIVLIPYAVDFLFKALHGFPKSFGELRKDGKLHCPAEGPVGLGQFIMKITRGIHERTLVIVLMGVEVIFGLVAIALYVWR